MNENKILWMKVCLYENDDLLGSWGFNGGDLKALNGIKNLQQEIEYFLNHECENDAQRSMYEWRVSFSSYLTEEEIEELGDFGGY